VEPGGVFLDVRLDRQKIRVDEACDAFIRVRLGFQPSASPSSRSRAEIEQDRPAGLLGLFECGIDVLAPLNWHSSDIIPGSRQILGRRVVDEEYLRTHTIGELKPLSGPVVLVNYDPEWPEQFQQQAEKIRTALGQRALRIEHVGSTSVPDLAAKPIIDIVLAVADSANEQDYVGALERAGYRLRTREPEWYEHRMFKGPENRLNLHVFSAGCPEIDRMLVFRDWLRTNEDDRELYARSKRALAQQEWKYTQNYADAKTTVIEEIILRARGKHY
jgi:GrpB-like predicted nucleotidyltransferase (UPF0157 family)